MNEFDCISMFRYDLAQETIDTIIEKFSPKMIIIFGSVARGTADEHSDLDILVIMDTNESYFKRPSAIYKEVYRIGIPKDILVLTPDEFEKERFNPYSFASEIVKTGKVAYEA